MLCIVIHVIVDTSDHPRCGEMAGVVVNTMRATFAFTRILPMDRAGVSPSSPLIAIPQHRLTPFILSTRSVSTHIHAKLHQLGLTSSTTSFPSRSVPSTPKDRAGSLTSTMPHPKLPAAQSHQPYLTATLAHQSTATMFPLPTSGAALSAAFYSPGPPSQNNTVGPTGERSSAASKARNAATQQYLTRSFIQGDENCQESSDLHPLLGSIFAYSNRCINQPARASEIAAGFRYFMPNGRLAYEWVVFWDIAPARYLTMAPPDVKQAYLNEHELTPCSMRAWVAGTIEQQQIQEADMMYQQLALGRIPPPSTMSSKDASVDLSILTPHTSLGKRKLEALKVKDEHESSNKIDPRLRFSEAKRLRLDLQTEDPFVTRGPRQTLANTRHWLRTIDQTVSFESLLPISSRPSYTVARTRVAQLAGQAVGTASRLQQTSRQQAHRGDAAQSGPPAHQHQPGQPAVLQANNNPHQHIQPAVNRSRIPLSRQARSFPPHTIVPGSVQHVGRGNVLKAWNPERVRAFTDIQGYPANELPLTAVSQYGDEMSRGHTPKSINPRHCPFDTTLEENITVRTHMTPL
jgi:hypothetical protein